MPNQKHAVFETFKLVKASSFLPLTSQSYLMCEILGRVIRLILILTFHKIEEVY